MKITVLLFNIIILYAFTYSFSLFATNAKNKFKNSIVRISTTYQTPSFYEPWRWSPPQTKSGQGVIINKNTVLTLASNVVNATMIKVKLNSEPVPTNMHIIAINLNSNLAILKGDLPSTVKPLKIPEKSPFIKGDDINFYWKSDQGDIMEGSAILERIEAKFISKFSLQQQTVYRAIRSNQQYIALGIPIFDKNNKFFGLAIRGGSEYEFSILTCDIIKRTFNLKKNQKQQPTGIPGFQTAPLTQIYYRQKLGLTSTNNGCLISKLFEQGTGIHDLKQGDVILEVDGKKIDAWGKYENKLFGMLPFQHLFSESYISTFIPMTIMRNKKQMQLNIKLASIDDNKWLIRRNEGKEQSPYLIRGGFIFIPMTISLLKAWGNNYLNNAPLPLIEVFNKYKYKLRTPEQDELVILSRVLPHPSNIGLQSIQNMVISKINGKTLKNLKQLKSILDVNDKEVIKLSLFPGDIPLWLNPKTLKDADNDIQKQYGIFKLEHFIKESN